MTISDIILSLTLIAIVFYTIETYRLRKWQQRVVKMQVLDLNQRILMHQDELRSRGIMSSDLNIGGRKVANIMNAILEHNKFDIKQLYAPGIIQDNK